jgi:hypothetical protein
MKSIVDWAIGITIFSLIIVALLYMDKKPELTTQYQVVTLPGNMFDLDVTVLITDDTTFAVKYVKENLDSTVTAKDFDSRATTFPTQDGKPVIIWMPYGSRVDVINHELFHATVSIMNWAGVSLDESTEEVYAYQLQYLSQQLDNQINIKP